MQRPDGWPELHPASRKPGSAALPSPDAVEETPLAVPLEREPDTGISDRLPMRGPRSNRPRIEKFLARHRRAQRRLVGSVLDLSCRRDYRRSTSGEERLRTAGVKTIRLDPDEHEGFYWLVLDTLTNKFAATIEEWVREATAEAGLRGRAA